MTKASAHDEEVEDFVGAEILMAGVKDRELQRVDHTASSIYDAASKEPKEGGQGKGMIQGTNGKEDHPSHADVENGGDPFWAGHPEKLKEHAKKGNRPYYGKKAIA